MKDPNCEQVETLLQFYIEGSLSKQLSNAIEFHLNICSECRNKYRQMALANNVNKSDIKQYEAENGELKNSELDHFTKNLSAYIDNELGDNDNFRIRKIAIINQEARKELQDILAFRQILQDSFNKTKSKLKKDYSEDTINNLAFEGKRQYSSKIYYLFLSALSITTVIIITLIFGIN